MRPAVSVGGVASPRGWIGLAFAGVAVYAAAKLMEFYPTQASRLTTLSVDVLGSYLPVAAVLGSVLLFAGLVGALWRANRAAGPTAPSALGVTAGGLGVAVLAAEAVTLVLSATSLASSMPTVVANAVGFEDILGNFLALAGLAALAWGIAHAPSLFAYRQATLSSYRDTYPADEN